MPADPPYQVSCLPACVRPCFVTENSAACCESASAKLEKSAASFATQRPHFSLNRVSATGRVIGAERASHGHENFCRLHATLIAPGVRAVAQRLEGARMRVGPNLALVAGHGTELLLERRRDVHPGIGDEAARVAPFGATGCVEGVHRFEEGLERCTPSTQPAAPNGATRAASSPIPGWTSRRRSSRSSVPWPATRARFGPTRILAPSRRCATARTPGAISVAWRRQKFS